MAMPADASVFAAETPGWQNPMSLKHRKTINKQHWIMDVIFITNYIELL